MRRGRGRGSRGQSLVELALAMPLLLWLACGLLDFGRAFYYAVTITDAARDGVRMLSTNTGGFGPGSAAGCSAVQAAVVDADTAATCPTTGTAPASGRILVGISCPDAGLCVGSPVSATHGQRLTVEVYYGFQIITPLIGSLVPGGVIPIHARAVMNASW